MMKRIFITLTLIALNYLFTSCTDLSEDNIQQQIELEIQNTGGEEIQDPDEEDEDPTVGGKPIIK